MEDLGLGPDEVAGINPGLIFARLTGWGQSGPYSSMAGHDINYIAMSGALSLFRRKGERPLPPCNLLGDFAGGGMLCAMGILMAIIERNRSGKGQVVDAAMIDGANNLSTLFWGMMANGLMSPEIGTNVLDTGAHFYETYETLDGKFVTVGAIEGKFYKVLLEGLGIDPGSVPHQLDMEKWPEMKKLFQETFKTKTRDEWAAVFEGKDACVAPVLEMHETGAHPHNLERDILIDRDGVKQPAPAPRLSRTPGSAGKSMAKNGEDTRQVLGELGYSKEEISRFQENGITN
jgi:alpha-methylacyl-CoA racemase